MGKIFVSLYNSKVCTHEHEWLERVEDAPWDRWMQLGLLAKVRLIDNPKDPGPFLSGDLRAKIVEYLADYLSEGYADDSFSNRKDSFYDIMRHGWRAYGESTDYELYDEIVQHVDESCPDQDCYKLAKEAEAELAVLNVLNSKGDVQ